MIGTISATVVLLTANYFVMFPLYATAMNFPMEKIVAAAHALNPFVTDLGSLMAFALLPFNIVKFGLNSVLAMLMYKTFSTNLKIRTLIQSRALCPAFCFEENFFYIIVENCLEICRNSLFPIAIC